jgi:hypothetical protein
LATTVGVASSWEVPTLAVITTDARRRMAIPSTTTS